MIKDESEKLYYIGGVVRDKILGKPSLDVDLTYEGNAIEFVKNLEGIEIVKINKPFGTVRVISDGKEIDIASTRAEIYEKPGHLPVVTKIGCDLKEDVLRRDFTINAMAEKFNTGEIVDYTGGLKDIENKLLRVLHDKSFIDDPTRILRALKFSVRFGFELEEHTKFLRDEYLKNINYDMSYKRVKKELIETFNLNSQNAYDEFIYAGIYKLVTEKQTERPVENIENLVSRYKNLIDSKNIWLIYIGTLPDLSKLELTKDEQKIVNDLKSVLPLELKTDFEIYKAFEKCRVETIILYAVLKNRRIAEHYINDLMGVKLIITGEDLRKLGIKPSVRYQECFDYILNKKLSDLSISYADEIEIAKEFFS